MAVLVKAFPPWRWVSRKPSRALAMSDSLPTESSAVVPAMVWMARISSSLAVLSGFLEMLSIRSFRTVSLSVSSLRTRYFRVCSAGSPVDESGTPLVSDATVALPGNRAAKAAGNVSPRWVQSGVLPLATSPACWLIFLIAVKVSSEGCCNRRAIMAGNTASDKRTTTTTSSID